ESTAWRMENVCCPQATRHFRVSTNLWAHHGRESSALCCSAETGRTSQAQAPSVQGGSIAMSDGASIFVLSKNITFLRSRGHFMSSPLWTRFRGLFSLAIFDLRQDLSCVPIVFYAAIEQFGAPQRLITDNGGVFRAKQLLAICEALEIEKEYIHPRQSWENLVETHCNVMRRMSQVHFEQVTSWEGAKTAHER